MVSPLPLSDEQKKDLLFQIRNWLGYEGIIHLKKIQILHGTLDATWMELGVADHITQFIPRSVYSQEAKHFKAFLKSIEISKDWSDEVFDDHWVWLLEESIK